MKHWWNPLQWNFAPRTVATLVAWAFLPVALTGFAVARSFRSGAVAAGLPTAQIDALANGMLRSGLFVLIPMLLVAVAAAFLFAWVVVQPLLKLRQRMEEVAGGDLSQKPLSVQSHDEVGRITESFNEMVGRLNAMVQTTAKAAGDLDGAADALARGAQETAAATQATAEQIEGVRTNAENQAAVAASGNRAVGELQDAAQQVADAAQAQAQEVNNAAETVKQVAAAIDQVAESANVVAGAAGRTRQAAEEGGAAVRESAEGMEQVRIWVAEAVDQLRELNENVAHVDGILQLITDIAGQTELLALNAAIEAARVGEHGKGFAVVAGEVRSLAERSRKAVGEITEHLGSLRGGAASVVSAMEDGSRNVDRGVERSQRAAQALDRILAAVAETQSQVESISAAAEEIAASSAQVVNTTMQLSAIAEENAATAEQMLGNTCSVTQLVGSVTEDADRTRTATTSMAAATEEMTAATVSLSELVKQVSAMAADLHGQVSKFRL